MCFIVELPDGVLIDRRADDGALAFTGGTLEDDESVTEGLARELREETGLEVDELTFLGFFSDPQRLIGYSDGSIWPILSFAFAVRPVPGRGPEPSDESRGFVVVDSEELRLLPLTAVHRQIRDAYLGFDGRPVIA